MDGLRTMLESMRKQNETIQNLSGLTSLQRIATVMARPNQLQLNLAGISELANIAKTISQQIRPVVSTPNSFTNNIQTQIAAIQSPYKNAALFGLTSTLLEIAAKNQTIADKIAGLATSQISLSYALQNIEKSINIPCLDVFNSIDVAFQGLSKKFIKEAAIANEWENISIVEEVNDTITNIVEGLSENEDSSEVYYLEYFKESIIAELFNLLKKTKTEKAQQFIMNLIAIASLLLTIYSISSPKSSISHTEIRQIIKEEITESNEQFVKKIEAYINKFNSTRIAQTNVNLRYSDRKKSKIIGIVKQGQQVTVIEIRHKYLLISYIDKDTKEPKSGFVLKKHFYSLK